MGIGGHGIQYYSRKLLSGHALFWLAIVLFLLASLPLLLQNPSTFAGRTANSVVISEFLDRAL
jgi:hypothetical protein